MFRVMAVVVTLALVGVVAAVKYCHRFILGQAYSTLSLVGSFPAQIANPTFIAFAITLVCLAVYVAAKYRFRRISRSDQRAVTVLCIEVVLVPIIINAIWCGHLNRTVVAELYNQDQRLHQPLKILFAIELPVFAVIAFCLINWCEANSQGQRVEPYDYDQPKQISQKTKQSLFA